MKRLTNKEGIRIFMNCFIKVVFDVPCLLVVVRCPAEAGFRWRLICCYSNELVPGVNLKQSASSLRSSQRLVL